MPEMPQQPPPPPGPPMDPNLILTLARDNRAADLAALIRQGVNPNSANRASTPSMPQHLLAYAHPHQSKQHHSC